MKKLFLYFCFVFLLSGSCFAKSACDRPDLKQALGRLDEMGKYFSDLKCAKNDLPCWWFKFHVAIGETGPQSMTRFAHEVPLFYRPEFAYGHFAGEAHIAQYPAYWKMKGISEQTVLSSGQTLQEFIFQTPWEKIYYDTLHRTHPVNINEELSWYSVLRSYHPELKNIQQNTAFESACAGGHHLTGLYYANDLRYGAELNEFNGKVQDLILAKELPPAYKSYPYVDLLRFYVLSHLFETYYLTHNKALVDDELVDKAVAHINTIYKYFIAGKAKFNTPEEFVAEIKSGGFSLYYYGDTLGHFRYGLKLCAGMEKLGT